MRIEHINLNDAVVYLPYHKLMDNSKIEDNQLGIVTSKNDKFVFVKYLGNENSQATNPLDLYSLKNRPDLREKLGLPLNPENKIDEIYLESKKISL